MCIIHVSSTVYYKMSLQKKNETSKLLQRSQVHSTLTKLRNNTFLTMYIRKYLSLLAQTNILSLNK